MNILIPILAGISIFTIFLVSCQNKSMSTITSSEESRRTGPNPQLIKNLLADANRLFEQDSLEQSAKKYYEVLPLLSDRKQKADIYKRLVGIHVISGKQMSYMIHAQFYYDNGGEDIELIYEYYQHFKPLEEDSARSQGFFKLSNQNYAESHSDDQFLKEKLWLREIYFEDQFWRSYTEYDLKIVNNVDKSNRKKYHDILYKSGEKMKDDELFINISNLLFLHATTERDKEYFEKNFTVYAKLYDFDFETYFFLQNIYDYHLAFNYQRHYFKEQPMPNSEGKMELFPKLTKEEMHKVNDRLGIPYFE